MQDKWIRAININEKRIYIINKGGFFHLVGDKVYIGSIFDKDTDILLHDVTGWAEIKSDGTIKIKKGFSKKTIKDIILERNSIRIKTAIYLLKKS